ncbi:MAG: DUF1963 domain-containing protein [Chloroflexota bacterium]
MMQEPFERPERLPREKELAIETAAYNPAFPAIQITVHDDQDVTSNIMTSKMGGTPYAPSTLQLPQLNKTQIKHCTFQLLGQLNFAELHEQVSPYPETLPPLPKSGILQLYYMMPNHLDNIQSFSNEGEQIEEECGLQLDDEQAFFIAWHPDPSFEAHQPVQASSGYLETGHPITFASSFSIDRSFEERLANQFSQEEIRAFEWQSPWRKHHLLGEPNFMQYDPRREYGTVEPAGCLGIFSWIGVALTKGIDEARRREEIKMEEQFQQNESQFGRQHILWQIAEPNDSIRELFTYTTILLTINEADLLAGQLDKAWVSYQYT